MSADQLLCKLRFDLKNKRFCSDINNPNIFVTVVNVCRASRGFQVVFKRGDDEVFCGYRKFLKRYPYPLK